MEFKVQSTKSLAQLKTPALIIGVYQNQRLSAAAEAIDEASAKAISPLLKKEFKATLGNTLVLRNLNGVAAERVIVMGLGKQDKFNADALLKAHATVASVCNDLSLTQAVNTLIQEPCEQLDPQQRARFAARALSNAQYRYTTTLSPDEERVEPSLAKVILLSEDKAVTKDYELGAEQGQAIASAMRFTRQLGNLPGNYCTPTDLGNYAKELAKEHKSLKVQVLEKKQIEALKMGAFLSVAAGSEQPPRFIVLEYTPEKGKSNKKSADKPIVFVGKGVTFDTGGISLKPGAGMDEMKWDMSGAATVLGLLKFAAEVGLEQPVVGLIAATENMPSGRATKPGDVVTSMSGQTIEILNTDAEGRLVLCDALTYAERYEPEAVIDIATLTGACVIALGSVHTGLYSNHEPLGVALEQAGKASRDTVWPMPLDDAYQPQLKSSFADMANIGGREAGSVTAACFLSRFTKKYHWAHLDVAGTAWDKKGADKGSTGRPVPLLAQYLLDRELL